MNKSLIGYRLKLVLSNLNLLLIQITLLNILVLVEQREANHRFSLWKAASVIDILLKCSSGELLVGAVVDKHSL